MKINIELFRSSDKWALMLPENVNTAGTTFEFEISSAKIHVPIAQFSSEYAKIHNALWEKHSIDLHYKSFIIRDFQVPERFDSMCISPLVNAGQKPIRIYVGLMETDRYKGNIHKNSFKFERAWESFYVKKVQLSLGGISVDGLDFSQHKGSRFNCREDYSRFCILTGRYQNRSGNGISYEQYKNNMYFHIFDLTNNLKSDRAQQISPIPREGDLRLDIDFNEPIDIPLSVIVFSEYCNELSFHKGTQSNPATKVTSTYNINS